MFSKNKIRNIVLLFTLPSLILFTIFIVYPLAVTLYRSFFVFNGFMLGDFIGFDNFIATLKDPVFWLANINTLKILFVQLLICGPFSYLLALLIMEKGARFRRWFKVAVFLPAVLNIAVISLMWKMMLQPEWGAVDVILKAIGLEGLIVPWLSHKDLAIWIIGAIAMWQYIGLNMLYFYSALKSIPESYYEAATVEGANFFHRARHISLPLSQEMIKFVLIISTTGTMQVFTQIQLLTNGGPGDLTRTLVFQMYYKAFSISDFGQAGAIAVLFAIQTFVMVLIINRFVARERIELT